MRDPLVSVIIPSYDRPLLLRDRAIPSVQRQNYENWEVIVVGDGPADDALRSVVENCRDRRIRYTEIPRPRYPEGRAEETWRVAGAAARNHGLELARGEILAPLDDDDEFLSNHLSDAVRLLRTGQHDLMYGSVIVRDIETGTDRLDYFPWSEGRTRDLFAARNVMFHSSVCYSSRFRNLRYPVEGGLPADYGLWRAIASAGGRITSVDRPQSVYYGDGLTTTLRVSIPSLPPMADLAPVLGGIFSSRVLSNHGPICQRFESAVAEYVGVPHAVSTPSGDIALAIAFRALAERCGARRRVLLPSYTHPSTANAVVWNGFEPMFVDIDAETLCISPDTVAPLIDNRVAAVVGVHAHGNPCDMPGLERLLEGSGVALVGDAAAAFGATLDGRRVGSFGVMEVLSFSGTKVLTAGEGGMICCRDEALAEVLRRSGRYGVGNSGQCESLGINGKLGEIPAAMALAGLPLVAGWLQRRRAAARRYREALAGVPALRIPRAVRESADGNWKDLPLVIRSRQEASHLVQRLLTYRIDTRPYYRPLHCMPAFERTPRGVLSNTEAVLDAVVCVPLYNKIRDEVVDLVCGVIREAHS